MSKPLPLVLILDNVRSAHNVGAIWRTAEAAGIECLVLVGITPHPAIDNDTRLPYVAEKDTTAIVKTALGAEQRLPFTYESELVPTLRQLRSDGYQLVALEQSADSVSLFDYRPRWPLALVVGTETAGLNPTTLKLMDDVIEIPQFGHKESLNVASATAITLYFLRYNDSN